MILFLLAIFLTIIIVNSTGVCDEKLFILELKQDIDDNGVLDCLRVIQQPHNYDETWKEKNLRLAAQWDSDCSFEADYDWMSSVDEYLKIPGLVNHLGDLVETDYDDQADLCEIVRAGIASAKFSEVTVQMTEIPHKLLDFIDCPGDPLQTEICAVTGSSLLQNSTWYILLDGLAINADQEPHFVKVPDIEDDFEIPEEEEELIQEVEGAVNTGEPCGDIAKKLNDNKEKVDAVIEKSCAKGAQTVLLDLSEVVDVMNIKIVRFANLHKTGDWTPVANMIMNEDTTYDFIGLAFYQLEGEFKEYDDSNIACRLMFDGEEVLDSRARVGNHLDFSIRGAFINKFEADFHQIALEYFSEGTIKTIVPKDSLEENINLQLLTLPASLIFYKYVQTKPLTIFASDKFEELPARLTFEIKLETQFVLVFYALSGEGSDKLALRLNFDEQPMPNTLCTSSNQGYLNLFAYGIVELEQGDHDIYLQSLSKQNVNIDPIENTWQSFAMSIMELPEKVEYQVAVQEKDFKLLPGNWDKFGQLEIKLKLKKNKLLFVWYQVSCNTAGDKPVAFKLMIDEVEVKTGRSKTSSANNVANAGSQIVKALEKGEHIVTLMYRQMTEGPIEFATFDIYQHASLSVLEFLDKEQSVSDSSTEEESEMFD